MTANDFINRAGVTVDTPKNIILGAGTIHKGLKYESGAWNFEESCLGATSGGSTFELVPEMMTVNVDGAWVDVKGLDFKTGETCTLETTVVELSEDLIKTAGFLTEGTSDAQGYKMLETKPLIDDSDYADNVAFVGQKADGGQMIIIMENAICTSGIKLSPKKKENASYSLKFKCTQAIGGDLRKLPVKIYLVDKQSQQPAADINNLSD